MGYPTGAGGGEPQSQGFLGVCALGKHVHDAVATWAGVARSHPLGGSACLARPHSWSLEVNAVLFREFSLQFFNRIGVSKLCRVFHLPRVTEHLSSAEPNDRGNDPPALSPHPQTQCAGPCHIFLGWSLRLLFLKFGGESVKFGKLFFTSPLCNLTSGFRAEIQSSLGQSSCAGGGLGRTHPRASSSWTSHVDLSVFFHAWISGTLWPGCR